MKPRIAVVTEIPTPYRQPVFEQLYEAGQEDYQFFFLAKTQRDRFWNSEQFSSIPGVYLPGCQLCFKGYHTIHFNWNVSSALFRPTFDAYVLGGYAQPALLRILRYCWKTRVPYVMWTESHLKKKRFSLFRSIKDLYVRRVYERASANLVMGAAARSYVSHYGAKQGAVFQLPNTIDGPSYGKRVNEFRRKRKETLSELGILDGIIILFVGTLNRRKGVDLLFSAFETILREVTTVTLLFVGKGEEEASLRRRTQNLDLRSRVVFGGFVQPADLPKFYAVADIFVLPSRDEPFGAVVCEAMAAGLPVIASDAVGATVDFVSSGETGVVVPVGDVDALARAMILLCKDSTLRKKMGQAGMSKLQGWTYQKLASHFRAAVKTALGNAV